MSADAGFFTNTTRDWIAVAGLIGTVATLIGLAIAVRQIRQTKKLAQVSKDAITSTLNQTRSAFGQYAMSTGRRLLSEAKIFVDEKNWSRASLRLGDLAEQAAQLAHSVPSSSQDWTDLASDFREWEVTYRKLNAGELEPGPSLTGKWHRFTREAAAQFDRHHGPFAVLESENG